MLTECPSCMTVFRVTGAILKMGHGQVRCGKCRKQFDAIECMLDEEETVAPQEPPKETFVPPQIRPEADAESDTDSSVEPDPDSDIADDDISRKFSLPSHEEVTMEGSRIEISGKYRIPAADESDDTPEKIIAEHIVSGDDEEDADEVQAKSDEILASEDIESEPDEIDSGEPGELEEPEPIAYDDRMIGEAIIADSSDRLSGVIGEPEDELRADAKRKRWRTFSHGRKRNEHAQIHAELDALTQNPVPRTLRAGVWATLTVLLVVALLAQMIHHNRDSLVRDPRVGGSVSRLYRLLGLSPHPHWDLSAYKWDIYKVGLDPQIADALRVTGSVANTAPFAQPYPQGKLSLQDRWGAPVGARAFEPYEYLPSPEASDRLMAPQQRTNIEIVIADPGPDAVGYLIHACLEQDKRLACADDFPLRP